MEVFRLSQRDGQHIVSAGIVGRKTQRLSQRANRITGLPLGEERLPQRVVPARVLRIQTQRSAQPVDCFLKPVLDQECEAVIVLGRRIVRVETSGFPKFGCGLGYVSGPEKLGSRYG